jgi:hypothetical protein
MAIKSDETVKSGGLSDADKQNIVAQAVKEIQFARRYKQGKVRNWQLNEQMYYGKKVAVTESRSNVDLAQMQEHVHTILSRVEDRLTFTFKKRKDSQLKKAQRLNALKSRDELEDMWEIKDIVGKKQAVIYGRSAFVYYADSVDGIYKAHLENIDIYDLLVDPSGGGIDVESMMFWGRYGVIKSKEYLEELVTRETDAFIKTSIQSLLDGSGNNTEASQEETNKYVRMYGQNTVGQKNLQTDEKYKFWEWFTTYKGVRYKLLIQSNGGTAISLVRLDSIFSSNLWPLITYAAFMDLTEFWTPSFCDYVREIILNQNTSINQMNDNAEAINKPMKVVNVGAIENLNELKYRRDGLIKTRGDFDANRAVQVLVTPSIDTPIKVFQLLEDIKAKATGVSDGDKGAEDTRGKVAIYKGNQAATQGRYRLFNKSYSFMYLRWAELYQWGVKEHLVKKACIDIIGPNGIGQDEVKRNDIFRKGDSFLVSVDSSVSDNDDETDSQTLKANFLISQANRDIQSSTKLMNEKKAFEIGAKAVGFTQDEIKELLDVSEYADEELMSEAAEDIEALMQGDEVQPNPGANNAYKQKMVDYMRDNQEDMEVGQFKAIFAYVRSLDQIIMANQARSLMDFKNTMANNQAMALAAAPPAPMAPPHASAGPGESPGMINNSSLTQ